MTGIPYADLVASLAEVASGSQVAVTFTDGGTVTGDLVRHGPEDGGVVEVRHHYDGGEYTARYGCVGDEDTPAVASVRTCPIEPAQTETLF